MLIESVMKVELKMTWPTSQKINLIMTSSLRRNQFYNVGFSANPVSYEPSKLFISPPKHLSLISEALLSARGTKRRDKIAKGYNKLLILKNLTRGKIILHFCRARKIIDCTLRDVRGERARTASSAKKKENGDCLRE